MFNASYPADRQDLSLKPALEQIVQEILSCGGEKKKSQKKNWGRMAQGVAHLPSKCEALSSNHSATKRKRSFYHTTFTLDLKNTFFFLGGTMCF
jgi:hypothetical protein